MSEDQQPVRWGVLSVLAAVGAIAVLALMIPFLDLERSMRPTPAGETMPAPAPAVPAALSAPVTKLAGDAASSSAGALALVQRTHTAVFAEDRPHTAAAAGMLALRLRVPVILVPTSDHPSESPASEAARTELAAEVRRRGVARAIAVGDGVDDIAARSGAREVVRTGAAATADAAEIIELATRHAVDGPSAAPRPREGHSQFDFAGHRVPAPPATGTALLVRPDAAEALAAVVTARAVGHTVLTTSASDLRADPSVGERLAEMASADGPPPLVLAGAAFADADERALLAQAAVAMTGAKLPGGDQLIFDPDRPGSRRYVGLYGVTQSAELGALGEQPVPNSVARARRIARAYADVVDDGTQIVPCFEIIATIASGAAGDDRNFSSEQQVADLTDTVDAAGDAGIYVLLDIQPGRTDFLTQAQRYEPLLKQPHVGLALDPEWRLGPGERHLEQIGSVDIEEINAVGDWLADLVDANRLPQKMFLLHQFRVSMLRGRQHLDTSRDALAYVIQMDGQGTQEQKLETWRAVTAAAPDNVHFGWKSFYDEDQPTRSPADTMALDPAPVFVSYQ